MDTSPRYAAPYPLPVRQASALLSASFRFAVARDTLAVPLTLPLVGRVKDFHLQVSAPCGRTIKTPRQDRGERCENPRQAGKPTGCRRVQKPKPTPILVRGA